MVEVVCCGDGVVYPTFTSAKNATSIGATLGPCLSFNKWPLITAQRVGSVKGPNDDEDDDDEDDDEGLFFLPRDGFIPSVDASPANIIPSTPSITAPSLAPPPPTSPPPTPSPPNRSSVLTDGIKSLRIATATSLGAYLHAFTLIQIHRYRWL